MATHFSFLGIFLCLSSRYPRIPEFLQHTPPFPSSKPTFNMERHPGWAKTQTPILRSPIFRRLATVIAALACICTTFVVFQAFASSELRLTYGANPTPPPEVPDDPRTKAQKTWKKLHDKYDHLDDTKFTYVPVA